MSNQPNLPAIRGFQMSADSIGNLTSSVNLFRSDVNYSHDLISLPGRMPNHGLDIKISAMLQSNVYEDATTWNRDKPTGSLGLGWDLPITKIIVEDTSSPCSDNWQYVYWEGSPNPLYRNPTPPFLFEVDPKVSSELVNGGTVPAALVTEFGAYGLPLSQQAVCTQAADQWEITDSGYQQQFTLRASDSSNTLSAYDGGQSFQLQNFQFWKVLYYPLYERWVVIKDDGSIFSFGGITEPTAQGYQTSQENSIEWGVRWLSNTSVPLWSGASATNEGQIQQQFAKSWALCRVSDPWGDAIHYTYNGWERDESGMIPGVEQKVGPDGLPYTKALYITKATDVFGQTVQFQYGDKVFDNSTPEAPKEYLDPHKEVPDNAPNAFQDCYETYYLDSLEVYSTQQSLLCRIQFGYEVSPDSQFPALANVNHYSGFLQGATYKRFLTSITTAYPRGTALPGILFRYYLDPDNIEENRGAIRSITYPEGSTGVYRYEKQALPICNRTQTIPPPLKDLNLSTPRVWFGSDYAVNTWYDRAAGKLSLQVFTWQGQWKPWQLDSENPLIFDNSSGLDVTSLDVIANEDFFALTFRTSSETQAYVFQKNNAQPSQWDAATIDGVTTALNTPTLHYPSDSDIQFLGGTNFLLGASMSRVSDQHFYDVVTYRWTTRSWEKQSFFLENYSYFAASNEYYSRFDMEGNVGLYYLDSQLQWHTGDEVQIDDLSTDAYDSLAVVPGISFVVAAKLIHDGTTRDYTYFILQWGADYRFQEVGGSFTFSDPIERSGRYPTSWIPQIVNNSMIGNAGHLLRFNGKLWQENSSLAPAYAPDSGYQLRFAYGPDYGLLITVSDSGIPYPNAKVVGYDANVDSVSDWSQPPTQPNLPDTSPTFQSITDWPSAGGENFLNLSNQVYFRGSSNQWEQVVMEEPMANLQHLVNENAPSTVWEIDNQSLINESPGFMAFAARKSESPLAYHVEVITLKNGQFEKSVEDLAHEKIYLTGSLGYDPGSGVNPGGPHAFVSFPESANNLDEATEIYLNRYAQNAIQGPMKHYSVIGLDIDDGFGLISPTVYQANPDKAAASSDGEVIYYFETTTSPGTSNASNPVSGYKTTTYLNGWDLEAQDNYYDMMTGMLLSEENYDINHTLVSSQKNKWQVFTEVSVSDSNPALGNHMLHGGWICNPEEIQVQDNVTSTTVQEFVAEGFTAPYSGQVLKTTQQFINALGETNTIHTIHTYAYQYDPACVVLNMLQLQAQTTQTWAQRDQEAIPFSAHANTYQGWPCRYGAEVLVPGKQAVFGWKSGPFSNFDYDAYSPDSTATENVQTGWAIKRLVVSRSDLGLVAETINASGTPTSVLFSKDQAYPVAQFENASLSRNQWTYLGFEDYETLDPWTFSGTALVVGDAHIGVTSLGMNHGASAIVSIHPKEHISTYVVGFWVKTPGDYQTDETNGFTVKVLANGEVQSTEQIAFPETQGTWVYQTLGIPLVDEGSQLLLEVKAVNQASQQILLDNVFVGPLVGNLTSRTFVPFTRQLEASMESNGQTLRTVYDCYENELMTVGPEDQVKEFSQGFLSRQGNPEDVFDINSPNADWLIHPALGGSVVRFNDGNSWQQVWQPSGEDSDWTVDGNCLTHTSTTPDTLTWIGQIPERAQNLALYFEVIPQGTLHDPIQLSFSGGYQIQYDPEEGWSFLAADSISMQSPLANPPQMAHQWLLVISENQMIFTGNGQLLFSLQGQWALDQPLQINTGNNGLSFANLTTLFDVRMGLSYQDAAGRDRQTLQLQDFDGNMALVMETISDTMNQQVATTLNAPSNFGKDRDLPLFAYRPHFADVNGFLENMASTWELQGDVADYYRGEKIDGFVIPNAEGYPYRGTRYQAEPEPRVIEQGVASKPYAIHDVQTTTSAERQTTQYVYSSNQGSEDIPAHSFLVNQLISPTKNRSGQWVDQISQTIGTNLLTPDRVTVSQTKQISTYSASESESAQEGWKLTELQMPNYFTDSPQTDSAEYVQTGECNPLQQLVQLKNADTGTTQFIYDNAGRLRFTQAACNEDSTGFSYMKYDDLGRRIEQGWLDLTWDPVALESKALQQNWPTAAEMPIVVQTIAYDGDGNNPNAISQQVQAITRNPPPESNPDAGELICTETWNYDASGNIRSSAILLSGAVAQQGVFQYAYNNLNDPIQVSYPEGSPLSQIYYTYDALGRMTGIGTSADQNYDLAKYLYSSEGNINAEILNGGKLTTYYTSNAPGWITSIRSVSQDTSPPCFALDYEYYADSAVSKVSEHFNFGEEAIDGQATYTCSYDAGLQLTKMVSAEDDSNGQEIELYDANGNIWKQTVNQSPIEFRYAPGTNQLNQVQVGDATSTDFAFSANGFVTQAPVLSDLSQVRSLEYNPCLNLTSNVTLSGNETVQVRSSYGNQGYRVCKQTTGEQGSTSCYFYGASSHPLAMVKNGEWSAFVYGPTGLTAMMKDQAYYPLKDNVETIRAVVDATNYPVARYDYLPFGALKASCGSNPDILPFRFTSQVWDGEVELYHFNTRLYDPQLQRFMGPDPALQFPSPYIYAGNNPLNMVDPTGASSGWRKFGDFLLSVALIGFGFGLARKTSASSPAKWLIGWSASKVSAGIENAVGRTGDKIVASVDMVFNLVFDLPKAPSKILVASGFTGAKYIIKSGDNFSQKKFFYAIAFGAGKQYLNTPFGDLATVPLAKWLVPKFAPDFVKNAQQKIEAVQGKIETVHGKIETIKGGVQTVERIIGGLRSRIPVAWHEGRLTSATNRFAPNLSSELTDLLQQTARGNPIYTKLELAKKTAQQTVQKVSKISDLSPYGQ